jgi:SAM-dependent methyltransferase
VSRGLGFVYKRQDIIEAMIARARRVVDDPRVSWRTADAQALPLGDGEVDAVVFQFGLMFVPDKARALREVKRVLRPGGTAVISVWDTLANNPASRFFHEHALAAFPDDPPTFMATPFSMGDARELRGLAHGFGDARVETVAKIGEAESAEDLAIGLVRGNPFWNQLVERGHDAAAFQRSVAAGLAERFGDRPCRSAMSAHVLVAH